MIFILSKLLLIFYKVDWFRASVGAPVEFNTVLFGGFLGSIFSFLQFIASPCRPNKRPLSIVSG